MNEQTPESACRYLQDTINTLKAENEILIERSIPKQSALLLQKLPIALDAKQEAQQDSLCVPGPVTEHTIRFWDTAYRTYDALDQERGPKGEGLTNSRSNANHWIARHASDNFRPQNSFEQALWEIQKSFMWHCGYPADIAHDYRSMNTFFACEQDLWKTTLVKKDRLYWSWSGYGTHLNRELKLVLPYVNGNPIYLELRANGETALRYVGSANLVGGEHLTIGTRSCAEVNRT